MKSIGKNSGSSNISQHNPVKANRGEPALLSRRILFGNPDRESVKLSPDGAHLSWLAPLDGVRNVWVAPRDNLAAARPVTRDTGRGIRFFWWAYTNRHILYIQDKDGDENWRLYAAGLESGELRDLTPFDGVQARVVEVSHKFPEEIIVGLNNRNPQWHDIYRLNLITGKLTLLLQHDRFSEAIMDDDYRLRYATQTAPGGSVDYYFPAGTDWQLWDSIPAEDIMTTGLVGFDKGNRLVYMRDSRGRNTAALVEISPDTKAKRLLADDARADIDDVLLHPTEKRVQAVASTYERKSWRILDPAIQADFDYLQSVADGEVEISSRSLDDRFWVARYVMDNGPIRFYLYDRECRNARFLFTHRAGLEGQPMVKMHSTVIKSRDGLDLVAYYSLPLGSDASRESIPNRPLPMVFTPHGGPWSRDTWGFHPWHQWLANRGYAVLSVNFRASSGFGKSFLNAANLEWGGKVMDDQQDAVQWAIEKGIADPKQVAVFGGSFGGYSALAGLTFTPEVFACGVDVVGPSNLITFMETVPPYWKPIWEMFAARIGDPRTAEGRALLTRHSPLTHVDRICRPLLIVQGANDPRVKQAESDQIVAAMQARKIPVTYLLYPDEGHGFARPENNLSFYAVAEAFLAKHIGGRHEPIGDDFKGSSIKALAGVEEVDGLKEAISQAHLGR
ncbi:MAG: S9 family peptidase [Planctomycetota bacterium]